MIYRSEFLSSSGIGERFFAGISVPDRDFVTELDALWRAYGTAAAECGCGENSEMLLRFHLSDVTNQAPLLRALTEGRKSFVSVIGQPPIGGRVALEAWHWLGRPERYAAHWFQRGRCDAVGSLAQTKAEFASLEKFLSEMGGDVASNTVRTWLYCRDVDNNYAGLVAGRNEFFAAHGLTADTHFIASTGIGGQSEEPARLVKMESLNFFGLGAGQLTYLKAPEMLSPTTLYGVSFERGTRLAFGDRAYCFISGTASIDREGRVVHPGDVAAQTGRMLDNVAALLAAGRAELSDVRWATLYLRDPADAPTVLPLVRARLGADRPLIAVRAPVCRPAWLVEMECVAVNSRGETAFAPLA